MSRPRISRRRRPGRGAAPLPALVHSNVLIPWEDLRGLLEKNGPAVERPPVDFAFSPATYDAIVKDKTVAVSAAVEVTLLVDGWTLAPLGPSASGIVNATVDGQPAPLVIRGDAIFALLKGKGQKKILLTIARDTTVDGASVRFDLPLIPSPLVTFSASIPRTNLAVSAPGAAGLTVTQNGQSTFVKGAFHGGMIASILWRTAPQPEAAGRPAHLCGQRYADHG